MGSKHHKFDPNYPPQTSDHESVWVARFSDLSFSPCSCQSVIRSVMFYVDCFCFFFVAVDWTSPMAHIWWHSYFYEFVRPSTAQLVSSSQRCIAMHPIALWLSTWIVGLGVGWCRRYLTSAPHSLCCSSITMLLLAQLVWLCGRSTQRNAWSLSSAPP